MITKCSWLICLLLPLSLMAGEHPTATPTTPDTQPIKWHDAVWFKGIVNEVGYGFGIDYEFSRKGRYWWNVGIAFPRTEELQADLAGPIVLHHVVHPGLYRKVDETNSWQLNIGFRIDSLWKK